MLRWPADDELNALIRRYYAGEAGLWETIRQHIDDQLRRTRSHVRSVDLTGSVMLLVAGTVISLVAAWALGRAIESMLFGIQPADPVSVVLAVLVLVTAALFAAWIPARRAARVDPMRALRWD